MTFDGRRREKLSLNKIRLNCAVKILWYTSGLHNIHTHTHFYIWMPVSFHHQEAIGKGRKIILELLIRKWMMGRKMEINSIAHDPSIWPTAAYVFVCTHRILLLRSHQLKLIKFLLACEQDLTLGSQKIIDARIK